MKVSYQWLSEYVNIADYSAQELAELMTRSGIEVDIVEKRNKGVQKVVVGYVKSKEKHPDADKLNVCIVDAGTGEDLQIVCGASNVDAGQKVPVAVVGAVLPGDFKIKKAKLRGAVSQGMICSAKELGMNDKLLPKEIQEGILVLPNDSEIGGSILDLLALDDEVLELELTPNRSDCLSMIGVAYEIAAILGREVNLPNPQQGLGNTALKASDHISVEISAADQCTHYAAGYMEEAYIAAAPLWMQNRLIAAGIRPINNIVDITNYVMLEYGQPLHAFDADQLMNGHIEVRLAHNGESMTTLDDVERTLESHMLLITDGEKPVGIAGVMGGANSEVSSKTTKILLESAKFAGSSVRKTSRQLGLRSEASLRFEKEADPSAVIPALQRASSLLAQYAGAKVASDMVEAVIHQAEPMTISLTLEKVNRYLGTEMSLNEMKNIFTKLQFFYAEKDGELLLIEVPTRRGDITRDVDLIEEVARLYGYDNIPTSLMSGATTPGSLSKEQHIRRTIRQLLNGSGINEVINYSFTDPQQIKSFSGHFKDVTPITLAMPMSGERSTLRTSLIPHLMDVAVYNRNRNMEDVAIFEIGKAFLTKEEKVTTLPEEKWLLSMLWTGKSKKAHWDGKESIVDFYDLKGVFEKVITYLGLTNIEFVAAQAEGYHPGRTAEILMKSDHQQSIFIGTIGQLHPEVQNEKDLSDTYILEVELEPLINHANFEIQYRSLPRYPSIGRDIALVLEDHIFVGQIESKIREVAGSLLESMYVFDIYKGERVDEGKKSVAFALIYRHPERTLTDEEVSELHDKVVSELEQTFQAELRK